MNRKISSPKSSYGIPGNVGLDKVKKLTTESDFESEEEEEESEDEVESI